MARVAITKKELKSFVLNLDDKGMKSYDIAKKLDKAGWGTPEKNTPWTDYNLSYWRKKVRIQKFKKRKSAKTNATGFSSPSVATNPHASTKMATITEVISLSIADNFKLQIIKQLVQ